MCCLLLPLHLHAVDDGAVASSHCMKMHNAAKARGVVGASGVAPATAYNLAVAAAVAALAGGSGGGHAHGTGAAAMPCHGSPLDCTHDPTSSSEAVLAGVLQHQQMAADQISL